MNIPKDIQDAIKNKNLVVFVGSGLSKNFELPDWKKMVLDILNDINDSALNGLIPPLDSGILQPIEVLDKLEKHSYRIHNYIKKNFAIDSRMDFSIHQNITKLTGKIISTNYDNAFEKSNNEIEVIPNDSPYMISTIKDSCNFVFKFHGCSQKDPSKCIIFSNDYKKLYDKENAANFKLKELFNNSTFLFIGFSFNDLYVQNLFEYADSLSDGNHSPHYILTKSPNDYKKFTYLSPIEIKEHEDISLFVSECLDYKNALNQSIEIIKPMLNPVLRIGFLYPEPNDLAFDYELQKYINCFDNLNVDFHVGYLNLNTLNRIEDYDYLIILSKSFKNKLYIEDSNIRNQLITFEEICKSIPNDNIIKVLISDTKIEFSLNTPTINITSYKIALFKKFIFKTIQNNELNFTEPEIIVKNLTKLPKIAEKGASKQFPVYGKRNQIDFSSNKQNIIGRTEDQKNIAERILKLISTNQILNIKGSGGIGKTSLVKKVSFDLYNRGYFNYGVSFRSCENIKSYQDFEEELINGFKFQNIIDFKEYLQENSKKLDLLIILDNFETIVNLESKEDYKKALSLLEFTSDYANIVLTSRENLNLQFEDVYPLSSMTTDDAEKLFFKNYKPIDHDKELKVLRNEILENLLNNNPLAIKLVTRNSPIYTTIYELKEHLDKYFFESTSEEFSSIYNNDADLNIERTRSIYNSINYSYVKLKPNEKICFELLHLFPDGINLSNFKKCFGKNGTSINVTDIEIKHLLDKSLIENFDGILQLQPIIRRFAEHQFSKRTADEKASYSVVAYQYNCHILKALKFLHRKKSYSHALKSHDQFKNNLFYVLNYIQNIEISEDSPVQNKSYFLNYIYDIDSFICNETQIKKLINKLDDLMPFFVDVSFSDKLIETLKLKNIYYFMDFDSSYKKMCELYSPDEMSNRNFQDEELNEKRYKNIISRSHSYEGNTLQYIKNIVKIDPNYWLETELFYVGVHNTIDDIEIGFYQFEKDLSRNSLNTEQLENYISSLFTEEHLERMQCTYILSKVKNIPKEQITKLVITNPYSRGLKYLMLAFIEINVLEKQKLFQKAIENLDHIKYYYLEANYYYCLFLKQNNDPYFGEVFEKGAKLSKQFSYQYLDFKYSHINLKDQPVYNCDLSYYNIDGFNKYLADYNSSWKSYFKENSNLLE